MSKYKTPPSPHTHTNMAPQEALMVSQGVKFMWKLNTSQECYPLRFTSNCQGHFNSSSHRFKHLQTNCSSLSYPAGLQPSHYTHLHVNKSNPEHNSTKCKVTCFLDCGRLLGDSAHLAPAHLVLSEHPEEVWVTHDEVWDGNRQSVEMLQHCEPFLQRVGTQSTNCFSSAGMKN